MNDPLAFIRRLIGEAATGGSPASADIPTLTRVAEPDPAAASALREQHHDVIEQIVAEYLPVIEHELRRRLRERLATHED